MGLGRGGEEGGGGERGSYRCIYSILLSQHHRSFGGTYDCPLQHISVLMPVFLLRSLSSHRVHSLQNCSKEKINVGKWVRAFHRQAAWFSPAGWVSKPCREDIGRTAGS